MSDGRQEEERKMSGSMYYAKVPYNGYSMRVVRPYFYEFRTNFKERWKGRSLLDVYEKEFETSHGIIEQTGQSYFATAIQQGLVRVNGQVSECDRKLKQNDTLSRITHRHEPPIVYRSVNEIICLETEDLIVCNKPSSMPIHPAGSYRLNTLLMILQHERPDLGQLFTIHRLDRLTSGLVLLGKNASSARNLSNTIQGLSKETPRKSYLAKVRGEFPATIQEATGRPGVEKDDQIFEPDKRRERGHSKILKMSDSSSDIETGNASAEAVSSTGDQAHPEALKGSVEWIRVSFPLAVENARKGVHKCDKEDGKQSESRFHRLLYDPVTDTSIVKCEPITGRTHQLRLHLQLIGHPIANDPNYGSKEEVPYDFESRVYQGDAKFHAICQNAFENMEPEGVAPEISLDHRNFARDLCLGCKRDMEPIRHHSIWLHAFRFRIYRNTATIADYRVPLPDWAEGVDSCVLWDD